MKTYKKVYIELTEEEKNTLTNAYKLLGSLYLNDDFQEAIDANISNHYVNLARVVSALADIVDYLGGQFI